LILNVDPSLKIPAQFSLLLALSGLFAIQVIEGDKQLPVLHQPYFPSHPSSDALVHIDIPGGNATLN
jgi:hypothetical protein